MDPLLMIVGGLGVVFMVWLGSRATLLHRRRQRLICPMTGKSERCTVVQNTLTKDLVDVEQCSAFGPRSKVLCQKNCVPTPHG
jgi:hypothetical protein